MITCFYDRLYLHNGACKLIFLTISAGAQKLNNNQHKKWGCLSLSVAVVLSLRRFYLIMVRAMVKWCALIYICPLRPEYKLVPSVRILTHTKEVKKTLFNLLAHTKTVHRRALQFILSWCRKYITMIRQHNKVQIEPNNFLTCCEGTMPLTHLF